MQKLSQKRKYTTNSYYINLGGDRIFSPKDYAAFSIQYTGVPSNSETDTQGNIEYLSNSQKSDALSYLQNDNKYHQATAYLYYKHSFSQQQSLEMTSNYIYGSSGSKGEQNDHNDFYQYNKVIDLTNNSHYGRLDLDYTNNIQNKYTISAGSNTHYSTISIEELAEYSPAYSYKKGQEYLYADFDNSRSGSKFNYNLSLGLDMLFTNASHTKNNYINVLPSLALAYLFNQKHTLSLNYKRNRFSPSAECLNPRNTSTDSLYIQQGNPYLTPQIQDNVWLAYKLNYKRLYLEPFINYICFRHCFQCKHNGRKYIYQHL